MRKLTSAALILAVLPAALPADEITDTLTAAIEAYEEGDIQYAIEELDYARQKLIGLKGAALEAFLPEAPQGWTREISSDGNQAMAMMGGGLMTEASYSGDGTSISITIMADNPMVASMAAMVSNAGAMGLELVRVGREKFVVQDDELTGLVDNRILIQASGGDRDRVLSLLEQIDFRELARF